MAGWLLVATPWLAGPLPACRYDDLPTRCTDPAEWERTPLDTI